ncbi:MAG TPA: MarR family transcriptional regulator [Clostridium sp.]|uniref:MarR family transcriptional regulator n=1 Tax=Acetivibrio mesophilus TaxID=2487273 RepID=A0A4Q0I490_9FIRM|nr:MarR family transcriptional regulator [Acetivibrio mesophilus]ODM26145.1 MarR family transcriptional regulator [Clostridium sp. Bc-iso-3]RXE59113.1 MarR family transcriptional regulator [Acetivibrio mesophilus]HHV29522.1 MarR family transcriptional regulator [Clostridium sp.]
MKTNGGFLISQIKQVQGRVFEKLLGEAGIEEFNGPQGRILYVLWQEDNLPIVELSRRTGLAKTTLTSMLDRLEARGFLNRGFDKSDRRIIRIILTDMARSMKDKYNQVSEDMNKIFYKGFSSDEITQFEGYLQKILDNLYKEENNK